MAKAIGFATQFYTLWDITSDTQYGTNVHGQITSTWDKITYTYLGNLSKDLTTAQEKAASRGCTDLEPDHELYGRNRSFEKTTPKQHVKEGLESSERSELLMICCSNDKENTAEARRMAIDILIKKGHCVRVNNIITLAEHGPALETFFNEMSEFMSTRPATEILIHKNLDSEGTINIGRDRYRFNCPLKSQYYNGINFYLPTDKKGKGKRIKNKTIQITDYTFEHSIPFSTPYGTWTDSRTDTQFYTEKEAPKFYGNLEITINSFEIQK